MAENKKEGNFLVKIDKINGGSHAASNFLKTIIMAGLIL